jgi:hypothetical protein
MHGVVNPSLNTFTMGDFTIHCDRESRRIFYIIVDYDKINQINVKQARNKKSPSNVFVISLHFTEKLVTVKSDFGEQFNHQLKHLIT